MATYYVDGAVGNDSNAGTSEGAGNAWLTIDKAMNTVAADDLVYVKASATYSETPIIDTNGGFGTGIEFQGYTTTPGDNGKVTIAGTTNCLGTTISGGIYYVFSNFKFNSASSHGVSIDGNDYVYFYNCEFKSNGGDGAIVGNKCRFINCDIDNNTSEGIRADGDTHVYGCVIALNGAAQMFAYGGTAYKTVVYGGTGTDALMNWNSSSPIVLGCTLDGEGLNVTIIDSDAAQLNIILDNIIYDGNQGVLLSGFLRPSTNVIGYNLINSNTTDYSETFKPASWQDVTAAPAFEDEANDDYTLGSSSPAIDAGLLPGGIT